MAAPDPVEPLKRSFLEYFTNATDNPFERSYDSAMDYYVINNSSMVSSPTPVAIVKIISATEQDENTSLNTRHFQGQISRVHWTPPWRDYLWSLHVIASHAM